MIAIITPNQDTFTNPTMVSLLGYLNGKGEDVTLFGPRQEPECPKEFKFLKIVKTSFKMTLRNPKTWAAQAGSYSKVKKSLGNGEGNTILAVDPLGLVISGRIKRYLCPKVKLCYLSFEIFFENELNGYYLKMKRLEKRYSKYIDALLSQDTTRRDLLFAENGFILPENKVALVPVSPSPIAVDSPIDVRKKLGIPTNKKVVVYSGSIGKWCGTGCIIEAFKSGKWPEDWHLVFHSRRAPEIGSEYYEDLMKLDKDSSAPFTLHPHPFGPMSDLAAFLCGFDAALALYFPNRSNPYYGKNMEEIGLSSGKFAMYMMLGLPTIVTGCRIYNELQSQYNFGACVSDATSLCNALKNSKFDNAGAKKLYVDVLKPEEKEFKKVLQVW